jgi:outer membrane receptor protein involved in Fe transport
LDAPDVSVLGMEQSGQSFKANLGYKPSANSLLYASWAEGFRLGRPAAGLIPAICDTDNDGLVDGTGITIESTRSIDSDNLDNYEIGGKFTLLGGRLTLDTAIYNIKWTGLPTNARVMCGADGYSYVGNAGEARSRGVEFQMNYQPGGGLRVNFGASYTDAELRTDNEDLGAFAGDRLPGSPRWIANLGLQYDFHLTGRAAFLRADSMYRGKFYSDFLQSSTAQSGGYVLLDARAGMRFDHVNVELFVDNLTDVDDFIWRGLDNTEGGFGYIMRPRTVGLKLGYSF